MKHLRCVLVPILFTAVFPSFAQTNRTVALPALAESQRRTVQDGPRDLLKETLRQAEKEAAEKNYKEMKDAATELALLSKQLSDEIDKGSQHVISIKVFDRIEKLEKLLKDIRNRASDF
jgi:hypothetical protein